MTNNELESEDILPDDLDITKYVGPYQFPTPRRRRYSAYWLGAISLCTIAAGIKASNTILIVSGIATLALGSFFFATAWPLKVNDLEALTKAATQAPFSVGHASAQLSFFGWLSKPMWRVVVFSSDDPPTQRGMVEIDAVTSDVASTYFDSNADESDSK